MLKVLAGAAFCGCAAFFEYSDEVLISVSGIIVFAFLAVLMAVALIDWDTQIIYDRFHIIILILGIIAIWVFPVTDIKSRIIGLFIISVPMYILTWIIPGAFGGGDVKLVAACGWFLGSKSRSCGNIYRICGRWNICGSIAYIKKDRKKRPLCILDRFLQPGVCCGGIYREFSCRLVYQSVIACVWERRF